MQQIFNEFREIKITDNNLRIFVVILGCLTGYFFIKRFGNTNIMLDILFLIPFLIVLRFPRVTTPIYKLWMMGSLSIGYVMNILILTGLFYASLVPIGFLMRLSSKAPLDMSFKQGNTTYWKPRKTKILIQDYLRQY